jgi:ribosomal protein S18 acetylase RimI-like enzyme
MISVRPARPVEFQVLNEIERIADRRYAAVGLEIVLGMPQAALARLHEGAVWVATDINDVPIGFLLAGTVDSFSYIDQISVLPAHGRKGIGSALMATALARAQTTPARAIILSTYRAVPWNQPFYQGHGFVEMPESEWTEEIHDARRLEAQQGHDLARRLFMWRMLR